jgi:DNA-binding NarL/FixJ family response regulator
MTEKRAIKLLLVEDSPADVRTIRRALGEARLVTFGIEHTDYLSTALTMLKNPRGGQFDAVLLDMNIQDSAGIETVTAVARQVPEVPIVVLSGQEDIKIADLTLRVGAADFLVKRDPAEQSLPEMAEELERKIWFALCRHEQFLTTQRLTRMTMEKAGASSTTDPAIIRVVGERVLALEDGLRDLRVYLMVHYPEAWDALKDTIQRSFMVPLRDIRLNLKLESNSVKPTALPPVDFRSLGTPQSGTLEDAERALLDALRITLPSEEIEP